MTTIPSSFFQQPQAPSQSGPRPVDPEKLAAQRAIFAQLAGASQAAKATAEVAAAAAPIRAAEPAIAAQTAPTARRDIEPSTGQPPKFRRPGSIIDIRV